MRTMDNEYRNDYKTARRFAGMTQERWAEAIGCSVDSVRAYETGARTPSDDVVVSMCEISGHARLAYWHLRHRSPLAADVLPDVERLPLPQAAIKLILAIADYNAMQGKLIELVSDGKITPDEKVNWDGIVCRLDGIIKAAIQVKVAEGGGGNA